MSLASIQRTFDRRSRLGNVQLRVVAAIVLISLVAGTLVSSGNATFARFIVAAAAGAIFLVMASGNTRVALGSVMVWLILLGFVRRLLIPFLGWSPNDPLLLVGPGCAAILLAVAPRDGHPERREALTPLVVFLFLWCLAEVMNPLQGSPAVGAKGLLVWIGPLLWFFVGKHLDEADEHLIRKVVLWCMLPVLLSGLYQTFVGFLPFEYTWVGVSGFGASIFVEGFKIRPFSTLIAPQEYGFVLAIAMAFIWPRVMAGPYRKRWLMFFLVNLTALLFQSTRSVMVFALVMVLITTMMWYRSLALNLVLSALVALVLVIGAGVSGQISLGEGQPWVFANHTINGLLHPNDSTLPIHKAMIRTAIEASTREPLGLGVGQASIAANKDGRAATTAENDFATTAVALGIVPALVFATLVVSAFVLAVRRFRRRRTPHDLATLGVFIVFLTQWWAVSMYAASTILWLTLGALAAAEARDALAAHEHRRLDHVPV